MATSILPTTPALLPPLILDNPWAISPPPTALTTPILLPPPAGQVFQPYHCLPLPATDLKPQDSPAVKFGKALIEQGRSPYAYHPSATLLAAKPPIAPLPAPRTALWGRPLTVNVIRHLDKTQYADLKEAGVLARHSLKSAVFRERQLVHRGVRIRRIRPIPAHTTPIKFIGPTSSYLNIPIEQDICRLYRGYPGPIPRTLLGGLVDQSPHASATPLPLNGAANTFHPRTGFYVYRQPVGGIAGAPGARSLSDVLDPRLFDEPATPDLSPSHARDQSLDDPPRPTTPKQRLNPHAASYKPTNEPRKYITVRFQAADSRCDALFDTSKQQAGVQRVFLPNELASVGGNFGPLGSPIDLSARPLETIEETQRTGVTLHRTPARLRQPIRMRYVSTDHRARAYPSKRELIRPLAESAPASRHRGKSICIPSARPIPCESARRVVSLTKTVPAELIDRKLLDGGFYTKTYIPRTPEQH